MMPPIPVALLGIGLGRESEFEVMASLYGYFDESGKFLDHPIVVFAGFVDGFQPWYEFYGKWNQWLRHYEITALHAAEALRHSQPYGKMKAGSPEDRTSDILPFVREITSGIELAVLAAVDVRAYKTAHSLIHQKYGVDPHYFAFNLAVRQMLTHFEIPKKHTFGLICDEDEEKAIRCYGLLKKLKREYPEVRDRVKNICFGDDIEHPQLQAADLFSYITRLEAQRQFAQKDHPYKDLKGAFEYLAPDTGRHLHFVGGYYGAEELANFEGF